jgi:hypothetical protein
MIIARSEDYGDSENTAQRHQDRHDATDNPDGMSDVRLEPLVGNGAG